ncbi:MAG: hypothetical protein RLZZ493_63, partial [Bacteroidota bacterium]
MAVMMKRFKQIIYKFRLLYLFGLLVT